jgi:hypothetical protein
MKYNNHCSFIHSKIEIETDKKNERKREERDRCTERERQTDRQSQRERERQTDRQIQRERRREMKYTKKAHTLKILAFTISYFYQLNQVKL